AEGYLHVSQLPHHQRNRQARWGHHGVRACAHSHSAVGEIESCRTVNFTPQEMKLVERLRKQERQWNWVRWVRLGAGICSLGICATFGFFLHRMITLFLSVHVQTNANTVLFILI